MRIVRVAALVYATVPVGFIAFQVALAAGAPWGAYAIGGAFPGRFSPALRIAALVQAALIVGMAAVVPSRAGLVLAGWSRVSRRLVWAVAFAAVSLVLNFITSSAGERQRGASSVGAAGEQRGGSRRAVPGTPEMKRTVPERRPQR